jgi:FkbM family methyltransferase
VRLVGELGGSMICDNLIFDVGMHIGQDTAFYLAKGFRVVAIEANPILVKDAERHFKAYIDSGQLTILNIGVGDKDGTFPFYVNAKYSEWSSFDKEIGSREGCKEVIEVRMLPFEKVLLQYGTPYYLKIDVEGHDFTVLQGLSHIPSRPRYVSIENGWPHILDYLGKVGYTGFKFINQAETPKMKCPSPAREGKDISWTFPWSSSGPFGEETPGDWKSHEDVLVSINSYWDNPNRDPNIDGWYDLHAKLDRA